MVVAKNEIELRNVVENFLYYNGVSRDLKGFKYMADFIILMKKQHKKYSVSTFNELESQVADKYEIEPYSVQRQLRYAVTLRNQISEKVKPIELLYKAYYEIKYLGD